MENAQTKPEIVPDIIIVGAGNVATHLARAFAPRLRAVLSRNEKHARDLAQSIGPDVVWGTPQLLPSLQASIIIFSLADNALAATAAAIGTLPGHPLVLHTSGTVTKDALSTLSPRTGVLYPLQTFSKDKYVDMCRVPFFTETAAEADLPLVEALAASVSSTVHHADEAHRRRLHIAGVFASNFPNILYEITGKILADAGYPLDTVRPLVEAMTAKAFDMGPHDAQTGPARRGDLQVMRSHEEALPPELAQIYHILSEYIVNTHKSDKGQ